MIASFPMYDGPSAAPHWDALWVAIRDHLREAGVDAPDALTRSGDPWADWQDSDLLLSQTCGLPFAAKLKDRLTLVAAPVWQGDIAPGAYHSVYVARAEDARADLAAFGGSRLAFNDALSQSGWGLLCPACAELGLSFGAAIETGSHRASALAVASGEADLAAIDCVTWGYLLDQEPALEQLKVFGRSAPSPALPFVTARPELAPMLFDALKAGLSAHGDALRFAPPYVIAADPARYRAIPVPPPPATLVG